MVAAAVGNLTASRARCPACDQEAAAQEDVLAALLAELTADSRFRYKLHGGLCLPHLRRAARRSGGQDVRWMIRFMIVRLSVPVPDPEIMAGTPDRGRDLPHGPPAALSGSAEMRLWICQVCRAADDARREQLDLAVTAGCGQPDESWPGGCLCAPHLTDLAGAASAAAPGLLRRQAAGHVRSLAQVLDGQPRLLGIAPGWLSRCARRALAEPDCPVCDGATTAATRELDRIRTVRGEGAHEAATVPLCVRHASRLHAADKVAGSVAGRALTVLAEELLRELDHAMTAGPRCDDAGAAVAAIRHASAFLNGTARG
jgi:hypothetical protein